MNAQLVAVLMVAIVLLVCGLFPTVCEARPKKDKPYIVESSDFRSTVQRLTGNDAASSSPNVQDRTTLFRPTAVSADNPAPLRVQRLQTSSSSTPFNTNQQAGGQQYLSGNNATSSTTTLGGRSTFFRPPAARAESSVSLNAWLSDQQERDSASSSSAAFTSNYFPTDAKAKSLMKSGIKESELMPHSWFHDDGSNRN
ncbi:hypothetical protein niasHS_016656 [Heterodera schachtii]|uniref:Uncharacterized protein n=2 Tax=Heterodera TaxID=34509 RepID=A0ABD2HZ44_HETSC